MDRTRRLRRGRTAAAAGLIAGLTLVLPARAAVTPAEPNVPNLPDLPDRASLVRPGKADPPPARNQEVPLASGALRDIVAAARAGAPAVQVDGAGMITVEVMYDDASAAGRGVAAAGGRILGEVDGWLLLASMPVQALTGLETAPGVRYVRLPAEISSPADPAAPNLKIDEDDYAFALTPGEHVAKTNADAWHDAGWTGEGLKIGIVDAFDREAWDQAVAAGELPTRSGEFCRSYGVNCDWDIGITHGVGVAEVIHEMVPDAELYIATVDTTTDLQAAVDWFAANGVTLVNRSLSARYDGPGDGTGPIDAVADSAVAQGITFFNSAGNFSGGSGWEGSYWRGEWTDADNDNWLEFDADVELNPFYCSYILGLRWDDWGGNRTDYDLYIYDEPEDFPDNPIAASVDEQQSGADPLEGFEWGGCSPGGDGIDYFAVELWEAGGGTTGDTLEFAVNGSALGYWSNPYSANQPISDSANPGVVSVGAIDPAGGTTIAAYSSWGPTNDERMKPDVAAASCLTGWVFSTFHGYCFNGTSAASPAALGAAALAESAGLASTPAGLTAWLYTNAITDRGAAGPDDVYGRGEVTLPAPPPGGEPANDDWVDATEVALFPYADAVNTAGATVEGWEDPNPAVCGIGVDPGATVWYTYTPIGDHSLTVDTIGSDFDTVLAVWSYDPGTGTRTPIACNDDLLAGVFQSEVTVDLSGGTIYYFQVAGYGGDTGHLQFNAAAPGFSCMGYPATIVGTGNAEVINGTAGVDVIVARGGDDTINGGGGDDIICGNYGLDVINGGGGNDVISGGAGADTIFGGSGNDTIDAGNGYDTVDGGDGNDTIEGRRAIDTIFGGPGDDWINGNDNPDVIEGGDGNDTIFGGAGDDQIIGDAGDDTIYGQKGSDDIRGDTDRDHLDGGPHDDSIRGNGGWDKLIGGPGVDTLDGGNGNDTVSYSKAPGAVVVSLWTGTGTGDGTDTLLSLEYVVGSAYADTLTGDGGDNLLTGGGGDDDVTGKGGADTIKGNHGNDVLRGSDGDDWLLGQAGNDELYGGAGTDTLDGGGGSNTCTLGEILANC
jgi:Ca2+-binding RTX toxin-like protein